MKEYTIIKTPNKDLNFYRKQGDTDMIDYRLKTFFIKEPETLIWLQRLNKKDVLWDIGANIGLYSIYSSAIMGNKTLSFEPSLRNALCLQESIDANHLNDLVTAYPIAIGVEHIYDVLLNPRTDPGHTGSEIKTSEHSDNNTKNKDCFESGCVVDSIDNLVEKGLTPPTHLKIDVDGLEPDVIKGAAKTLPKVKSILIELTTVLENKGRAFATPNVVESHIRIKEHLKEKGFELDETLSNYSKQKQYHADWIGVCNYIYYNKNVEQ